VPDGASRYDGLPLFWAFASPTIRLKGTE
jgi:hypothetical protein